MKRYILKGSNIVNVQVSQAQLLKNLYAEYMRDERFEDLKGRNINFVPGMGPLNPDIMLVGEMPGRIENKKSRPFIGRAGSNLNTLLMGSNIEPSDIFKTNVSKYWPQGAELTKEEIQATREYLKKEIDIVDPLLVGLCGLAAIHAIYPGKDSVYEDNGNLLDGRYIPLYHPAVFTHDPNKAPAVKLGYARLYAHSVANKRLI